MKRPQDGRRRIRLRREEGRRPTIGVSAAASQGLGRRLGLPSTRRNRGRSVPAAGAWVVTLSPKRQAFAPRLLRIAVRCRLRDCHLFGRPDNERERQHRVSAETNCVTAGGSACEQGTVWPSLPHRQGDKLGMNRVDRGAFDGHHSPSVVGRPQARRLPPPDRTRPSRAWERLESGRAAGVPSAHEQQP